MSNYRYVQEKQFLSKANNIHTLKGWNKLLKKYPDSQYIVEKNFILFSETFNKEHLPKAEKYKSSFNQ